MSSLSHFPGSVQIVIDEYDKIIEEEGRLNDLISGYIDTNEEEIIAPTPTPVMSPEDYDDSDDDDDDDDDDEEAGGLDPEEARERFDELRAQLEKTSAIINKHGFNSKETKASQAELSDIFVTFKLIPRIFDLLVFRIRNALENIRKNERAIMQLCVRRAKMPRKIFLKSFPGNETNLEWIDTIVSGSASYAENIDKYRVEIIRAQKKLTNIERDSFLNLTQIKDINRKMSLGEARARGLKKRWSKPTCDWLFLLPKSTPTVVCNSWT